MQNACGDIPSIDNAVDVKILPQILKILPDVMDSPSVTMSFAVYSAQASDIMQEALQELYIGSIDAKTAAKRITKGIQRYPVRYRRGRGAR
jgi:hypothetical protein